MKNANKEMQKVADKIAKLLSLAEKNPNESEAQAAWGKAQALATRYQLDLEALRQDGNGPAVDMITEDIKRPKSSWQQILMVGLTEANTCAFLVAKYGKAYILGEKQDVQIVLKMYETISRQINQLSRVEAKARGERYDGSWGHGYRVGLATRVGARLDEATKSVHTSEETGLVLVRDARTKEYQQERFPHTKEGSIQGRANGEAMALGYEHGDRVQIHGAVTA